THQPPRRHVKRGVVAIVAAGVLGGGLAGGAAGATLADNSFTSSLTPLATAQNAAVTTTTDVSEVAAKVTPGVVQVNVRTANGQGLGSGVILSADGRIVTNNHVVAGADDIRIIFADGRTASARVVGGDSTADLAVLQADGVSGLTPATLGDSADVRVGDQVIAIGSPAGLQNTVTTGIVSAVDREVTISRGGVSYRAIQTDASINQGNSGGPLFDATGRVIGINSAIYSPVSAPDGAAGGVGIGFSIPVDTAKKVITQIT
nr:trypsin-like peptidase domain-containing protein [Actinomycetota bacterium]